jgi:signal peptidase I
MESFFDYFIVFAVGFISCASVFYATLYFQAEKPFSLSTSGSIQAPSDWIKEGQISIYKDRIVIKVENLSLSNYAATGSMIPALDENSNGIRIKPASPEQISAGDIVTFRRGEDLIVHRVIEKGNDEKGVWFVTKGDNSDLDDGKIYFSQVEYVTIGVLY